MDSNSDSQATPTQGKLRSPEGLILNPRAAEFVMTPVQSHAVPVQSPAAPVSGAQAPPNAPTGPASGRGPSRRERARLQAQLRSQGIMTRLTPNMSLGSQAHHVPHRRSRMHRVPREHESKEGDGPGENPQETPKATSPQAAAGTPRKASPGHDADTPENSLSLSKSSQEYRDKFDAARGFEDDDTVVFFPNGFH